LPSPSSTLVLSTSPAIFDLFRALYPVSRGAELEQNITTAVEYANDCLYLAERARKVALCINISSVEDAETLRGKFNDVAEKLECIGESWLQEVIVSSSEKAAVMNLSDVVATRIAKLAR
jgi:centromere/kinetochore protein ZW10